MSDTVELKHNTPYADSESPTLLCSSQGFPKDGSAWDSGIATADSVNAIAVACHPRPLHNPIPYLNTLPTRRCLCYKC